MTDCIVSFLTRVLHYPTTQRAQRNFCVLFIVLAITQKYYRNKNSKGLVWYGVASTQSIFIKAFLFQSSLVVQRE